MLAIFIALSCTKDEPMEEVFSGCDPTDEAKCYLPYPSTYHMAEADTASGWQVAFSDNTLPVNIDDVPLKPDYWNEKDGFSTLTPLLAFFDDLSTEGLVGHDAIEDSLGPDATIVLVEAATGERVPYFAELDMSGEYDSERYLIIRPVTPLKHGTRYVVGLRGLSKKDGSSVDVSDAFAALRDGTETNTWDVEGRRSHFDASVFGVLEDAGMSRGELQLAWDFVTVSAENSLDRAIWMRDDAAERFTGDYEITRVDEESCEDGATIGKTLYVDFTVPMYTETAEPGTFLTRDADGMPYYNGDTTAEVMVRIPCSLLEEPRPGMVLQYGHGLLGDYGEARTGYLSQMADDYGWIVIASDWVGMAEDDRNAITEMLVFDVSDFALLPERSLQGFVQKDLALRLIRGTLASDPELMVDDVPLVDTEFVGYYGNSQGAILGGGYVGMSDQIERAVLGVGGAPYAILLSRSADFTPFFLVFQAKFDDHRDIAFLIAAMQTLWDPAEAAGWAWQMNQEPVGGNPPKQILQQVAIGDAQVTTLGAEILARAYQQSTVAPQTRAVWGIEEQEAPFEGSALVEWYYPDGAEEPTVNTPPDGDLDTHECPRREPAAQQQLHDFLVDGVIEQYCDGVCEGTRVETGCD